jgi:hypothetical protein
MALTDHDVCKKADELIADEATSKEVRELLVQLSMRLEHRNERIAEMEKTASEVARKLNLIEERIEVIREQAGLKKEY